jgi:hypothetical protein
LIGAAEREWQWSEKYATQPEILSHANHVADKYGLRKDIRFATSHPGARAWLRVSNEPRCALQECRCKARCAGHSQRYAQASQRRR